MPRHFVESGCQISHFNELYDAYRPYGSLLAALSCFQLQKSHCPRAVRSKGVPEFGKLTGFALRHQSPKSFLSCGSRAALMAG